MLVLRLLHSLLAGVLAVPVTTVCGLLAVLASLIPPRGNHAVRIAWLWGRLCLLLAATRLRVEGSTELDPRGRYVVMANHESALDIPALLAALPVTLNVRFLAKKSLFRIPFLGWAMRGMGFIPVDRANRSTAAHTFERSSHLLAGGRSVLIFPEETRSPDGELLPFQRGGFLMALKSGLPILPVGIEGTRIAMPARRLLLRATPVVVRIGEPLPTAGRRISDRRLLTEEVRAAVDRLRGSRGHAPTTGVPGPGDAG